jgi:antitoxin VapB
MKAEDGHRPAATADIDEGLADRLLAIGADCATRLREPHRSVDHADLLYDEAGLPR